MAAQEDKSLSGEATFAGKAAVRPQHAAVSLGGERTIGGDHATQETVIDDIEVVDLDARYRPEGTIGQGGMGAVVLATDTRLDRKVAIKRILGEAARNRTAVMRFLTEAKAIAALNHPNIVQIYDYGRTKDGPFLIMEFVDGGSLFDACKAGPLPLEKAVDIVCQICEGLGAAHEEGIVHRDIKPANILLNRSGLPKLTDFGLAKAEDNDHGMTMAGAVMGTPDFMPPEQRRDASLVDYRSDLWSLAATFYQMVTGRSPKIIRLRDVPAGLQPILEKALEDAPEQRYQSATDFREAIRAAVGLGTGRAVLQQASLVEGQCPACGTVNSDVSRKFCRQCGTPSRTPCLRCDQDMPVWDAVCGECGAQQAGLLETRIAELQTDQGHAKKAYKQLDFPLAISIGERLASLRHPQLSQFVDWGRSFVSAVGTQRERLATMATERLTEARTHRREYDYKAAIRAIESIPAAIRDDQATALLEECRATKRESDELLQVIAERIKRKDIDGLLPQVERAAELQGNRPDIQRILSQLRLREEKLAPPVESASLALANPEPHSRAGDMDGSSQPGIFEILGASLTRMWLAWPVAVPVTLIPAFTLTAAMAITHTTSSIMSSNAYNAALRLASIFYISAFVAYAIGFNTLCVAMLQVVSKNFDARTALKQLKHRWVSNFLWSIAHLLACFLSFGALIVPGLIVTGVTPFARLAEIDARPSALATNFRTIRRRPGAWLALNLLSAILFFGVLLVFFHDPKQVHTGTIFFALLAFGLVVWWQTCAWALLYRAINPADTSDAGARPPR